LRRPSAYPRTVSFDPAAAFQQQANCISLEPMSSRLIGNRAAMMTTTVKAGLHGIADLDFREIDKRKG
jgi:hypothetical protein